MTVQRVKLKDLTHQYVNQLHEQYGDRDIDVEIKIPSESASSGIENLMNEDKFWEIISLFDWLNEGNDNAVIEPAVQALSHFSESAILSFYDLLSEKLYLLDGQTYAEHSMSDGHLSADLFLYARCCVVANGRSFFEDVLKKPSKFPKDLFFEKLLDIPERAWFRKTGKNLDYSPKYIFETGFNPHGWGAQTITL